jgi:hypothetical protein
MVVVVSTGSGFLNSWCGKRRNTFIRGVTNQTGSGSEERDKSHLAERAFH